MAQVLTPPTHGSYQNLSDSPLLRRSASQSSLFLDSPYPPPSRSPSPPLEDDQRPFRNEPYVDFGHSPLLSNPSSYRPTTRSALSLESKGLQEDDDDNFFPTYDESSSPSPEQRTFLSKVINEASPLSSSATPDSTDTDITSSDVYPIYPPVADDTAVKHEPSHQVDYLSHNWTEEDIWSSWKHIVSRRKIYGERSRLENASWRTWAKQKNKLKTVRPETLNWLKDCDVTWLYGPLQEGPSKRRTSSTSSEPASRLSKTNSFVNKKPILKKRSVSEDMLQKSISSSSLVKQAAAAVQAQRSFSNRIQSIPKPKLRRTASDYVSTALLSNQTSTADSTAPCPSSPASGVQTPENPGKRHIRFDNKVEQCIAVEFKEGENDEENTPDWANALYDSDDDDEDDMPMIKTKPRKLSITPASSRNSFSQESKGIAMLPSTTLKFHHDEPSCQGHPPSQFALLPRSGPSLATSPSLETLRPSKPSSNFLLSDEDQDEEEMTGWESSGAFKSLRRDSISLARDGRPEMMQSRGDEGTRTPTGLRRTPSGMFMPEDDEEDGSGIASNGVLGRLVDTVNTARDIMAVFWNVGWHQ